MIYFSINPSIHAVSHTTKATMTEAFDSGEIVGDNIEELSSHRHQLSIGRTLHQPFNHAIYNFSSAMQQKVRIPRFPSSPPKARQARIACEDGVHACMNDCISRERADYRTLGGCRDCFPRAIIRDHATPHEQQNYGYRFEERIEDDDGDVNLFLIGLWWICRSAKRMVRSLQLETGKRRGM